MIQALNYTAKAISDIKTLANGPGTHPYDKAGMLWLVDLLAQAETFVLPEFGELLDRGTPRPEVTGLVYRPPFPVVALEYPANTERHERHPVFEPVTCSRRIALAWLWQGGEVLPLGPELAPGEHIAVTSITYIDHLSMWVPIAGAMMIPFDAKYSKAQPSAIRDAFLETGKLTRRMAAAPQLEAAGMTVLLPVAFTKAAQVHGRAAAIDAVASDLSDEVNAYLDVCLALHCGNVSAQLHRQPEKLNRARERAGKAPLKDFHVLQIAGQGEGEAFGAGGGDRRSHLRRGHIRRLGPERLTWVNACMVRGSAPGFADKAYAISGACS